MARAKRKSADAGAGQERDRSGLSPAWRLVGWLALAALVAFLGASLLSFDPADAPSHVVSNHNDPPANWCGRIGAFVAYYAYHALGHGLWAGLALLLAYLALTAWGTRISHAFVRLGGVAAVVLAVSGLQYLWFPQSGPFPEGGGGLLAIAGVDYLVGRFNGPGTAIILTLLLLVGAIVAADRLVLAIPVVALRGLGLMRKVPVGRAMSAVTTLAASTTASLSSKTSGPVQDGDAEAPADPVPLARRSRGQTAPPSISPDAGGFAGTESFAMEEAARHASETADAAATVRPAEINMEALREKIRKLPVNISSRPKANSKDARVDLPRTDDYSGYQFPSLDLLIEPEETFTEKMEQFVREQAEVLEHALMVYGIEGEVVGIDSGPVITLYEVQLTPGTKVSSINSIASDIARSLRAQNIRIVANMAGKSTIGVEVPNLNKEKVRIKELMTAASDAAKMRLPMFLGKDASGTPLIADLSAMPHMLVAGTTGSGKSVCINTIIMSFLYTRRPDELKLILVDPKMVEMGQFKEIPHLMCPVVTEMGKAAAILEWAVTKMEERYELLSEVGVRDVAAYNMLTWEEIEERLGPMTEQEAASIPKKIPYIVFIIDELADLIMTHKEVETHIVRIAQKARAVGIHLILATQRPQANVVTGLIKSNMPCRVSFKVASGMDSRIVLDQKGAELLLGQGDMMFLGPRTSEVMRAQGTLVDDLEIRRVTRFLKEVAAPSFERQLMVLRAPGVEGEAEGGLSESERDPLFFKAVDIIVESGRGSVSLLQRRLAIGYTRASRLIDQMGLAGIIGEHKGSVAREVIVTPEEWEQMRRMMEEGEAEGTLFSGEGDDAAADAAASNDESDEDEGDFDPEDAEDDEIILDDEDAAPFDATRRFKT